MSHRAKHVNSSHEKDIYWQTTVCELYYTIRNTYVMPLVNCNLMLLRHRAEALSDAFVWRLSVAFVELNSRTERPRKTRIGTKVAPRHMWLGHHFQGQYVKGQLVADVLNSQHAGTGATWRINTKTLLTCRGGGILCRHAHRMSIIDLRRSTEKNIGHVQRPTRTTSEKRRSTRSLSRVHTSTKAPQLLCLRSIGPNSPDVSPLNPQALYD